MGIITSTDSPLLLHDYFNQFPALKQVNGYELLCIDFNFLHPEKEHFFATNIVLLSDGLLEEAKKRKDTSKVTEVQKGLSEVLALLDPSKVNITSSRVKSVIAICTLPYVMNIAPSSRKTKKSKVHTFTREERRDSFITHISSEEDIGTTILSRQEKYSQFGAHTLQPYIITVGSDLLNVTKAVIVINNTKYELRSLVEAVDVLFKIFIATNTCYPEESYDVWMFIQKGVYKMSTAYDRVTKPVSVLLDLLNLS